MSPVQNSRVIYNAIPEGYPVPGLTTITDKKQTMDLDNVPLDGGFLLKTLVISVDPYLRGRMRKPEIKSYSPPFNIGDVLYSHGVSLVLRSENPDIKVGDHLYGITRFQDYNIYHKATDFKVLPKTSNVPWSVFVGVAGMPGKTAYYGYREMTQAKKGETIYVSTAAGPVGSLVVQLAKADGLKVIGSAGSSDKLDFLREIGVDVAFNYKETSISDVLAEHGPVDIYWDHVGGKALDSVLSHMNTFGRILVVGQIASYNSKPEPISNMRLTASQRLTIRGLLVGDWESKYGDEFYNEIPPKIARGEIRYTEHVVRTLDEAGQLILDVQKGDNKGKAVIVLANE